MKNLRIFEQNFGEKELVAVILENDLDSFIETYKDILKKKYPDQSYLSFGIESVDVDDHMIVFKVNYTFKNSSYFSTKLLSEYHTLLIKEVEIEK